EALLGDTEERLRKAQQAAQSAEERLAAGGTSGGGLSLSDDATSSKLQEAYRKVREAEMKAGQAELQLQKAIVSLKEYEQRANESDRETQRLAFQDPLTGLPNLNLIRQYLDF